MANNSEKSNLRSGGERALRFLRDIHIGIGGAALAGTVLFPPLEAVAMPVAVYEGLNALAHEGLRRVIKGRSKS
jgi:hypothetical protein